MTENDTIVESQDPDQSIQEILKVEDTGAVIGILQVAIVGAFLYIVLSIIPMPYLAISLFKFGFVPGLSIIAVAGAYRGPLAGFLTGYLGGVVSEFALNGAVAAFSLYAFAFGVLGFVVGLASFDFKNGRSLAKLSLLSLVGLVFTALITAVVGIFIEGLATLVVIAFQLLTLLSLGIPSVILLTPLFARLLSMLERDNDA